MECSFVLWQYFFNPIITENKNKIGTGEKTQKLPDKSTGKWYTSIQKQNEANVKRKGQKFPCFVYYISSVFFFFFFWFSIKHTLYKQTIQSACFTVQFPSRATKHAGIYKAKVKGQRWEEQDRAGNDKKYKRGVKEEVTLSCECPFATERKCVNEAAGAKNTENSVKV